MKNTKHTKPGTRITNPSILIVLLFTLVSATNFSLQANESNSVNITFQPEKPTILYIVDGEEWSVKEVDELDLDEIEQIEHIREEEKIKLYTEKDVDMVVIITLKQDKDKEGEKEQLE